MEILDPSGERVVLEEEGLGIAAARVSSVIDVSVLNSASSLQIVGATATPGTVVSFGIRHSLSCRGANNLKLELSEGGARLDAENSTGVRQLIARISKPWAVDSTGAELPTWYETDGLVLRQFVDTRLATGPVTFDPTYTYMTCDGYSADVYPSVYLNFHTSDVAYCPIMGLLWRPIPIVLHLRMRRMLPMIMA